MSLLEFQKNASVITDYKQTAIITGGSSGMGLAVARKLNSAGMNVIVFDVQTPPDNFEF